MPQPHGRQTIATGRPSGQGKMAAGPTGRNMTALLQIRSTNSEIRNNIEAQILEIQNGSRPNGVLFWDLTI
jgi:hypothetical protein